jgi:hypothetical protein
MAEKSSSGGIGLFGCLFLIFLVLKLAEVGSVARWSWWWVTAPLWAPILLVGAITLIAFTVVSIAEWFKRRAEMKRAMED